MRDGFRPPSLPEGRGIMGEYAVEMRGITKVFGGCRANDNIDFKLKIGSIHGLLGENGAGKTTLMNILYGLYRQEEGCTYINGQLQDISSPQKAIALGVGMVHQHFMLVRPFTVTQNMMLGRKSGRGMLLDTKAVEKRLSALSEKYHLRVEPSSKIWQLSVGEQQRVEILSTIYQGAEILILDEPTAVLTPKESAELFDILRSMRGDGKSIILITHKLEEILSVVDEVTVLRDGRLVGSMEVTEDTTREQLSRMMVGRDVLFDFTANERTQGKTVLETEGLCARNSKGSPALSDFSLTVQSGEIVGLAGVDGNGQKELAEVLTGLARCTKGGFSILGERVENRPPLYYIRKGVAHIPEDRQHTGLGMGFSIARNLVIKNYNRSPFARYKLLNRNAIRKNAQNMLAEFNIKANSCEDLAKDLSGGNQQKVILARELSGHPILLIGAQPTRGLDIGATEYIRKRLMDARNSGAAVLLISSDLEEILQLSDRIAVIYGGRLMGVLPRGACVEEIGMLMMGKRQEVNKHAN